MTERLAVTYVLTCAAGEDPEARAREVGDEQTVELPPDCVPVEVAEARQAIVEEVEESGEGRWRARVSYDAAVVGGELGAVLNLLFGNVSMQGGVRVESVEWPPSFVKRLAGPRFGIAGLREICAAERRPLLCAALKPLGLSAAALAARARELALAGVDIVKDDHSLADQPAAPFTERVERCQEAVTAANQESGGRTVYFPNLPGDAELPERMHVVLQAGCFGALVSPLVLGLGTVVSLAQESGLVLLGHPALAGAFFAADHGIAAEVMLGQLFRMCGCDGVIYPNTGGRFLLDEATCAGINTALRARLGHLLSSFPVAGGGVEIERVPEWIERYGRDLVFLIGTGLYREADLRRGAERLMERLRREE